MKAVLALTMPFNCGECPLHLRDDEGHDWCSPLDKFMFREDLKQRLYGCPLKTLPEKYDVDDMFDDGSPYGQGWMDCYNEILGEIK